MKSNWQEIITTILTDHVGALAYVVIDDAIAKTMTPPESGGFLQELVLRVVQELPEEANRAKIAAQIREAIR